MKQHFQLYIQMEFPNWNDELISTDSRINDRLATSVGILWDKDLMTWATDDLANNVIEFGTPQNVTHVSVELLWRVNNMIYRVFLNDKDWSMELWL